MEYLFIANALVFGLLAGISVTTTKGAKREIAVSVTVVLFALTVANIIGAWL